MSLKSVLRSNGANLGGSVQLLYVPVQYVNAPAFPIRTPATLQLVGDIVLTGTRKWFQLQCTRESVDAQNDNKPAADGSGYTQSASGFIAGDSHDMSALFDEMREYRYLVLRKDANQHWCLLGTIKEPLSFQYKKVSQDGIAKLKGYHVEFASASTKPELYYSGNIVCEEGDVTNPMSPGDCPTLQELIDSNNAEYTLDAIESSGKSDDIFALIVPLLSNTLLAGLTADQLAYIITLMACEQILLLSNEQLDCLTDDQLNYIVTRLGEDQVQLLDALQILMLSCSQIGELSNDQLDCLITAQLNHIVLNLAAEQIHLLSEEQVNLLLTGQVQVLDSEHVNMLSTDQVEMLDEDHIHAITCAQILLLLNTQLDCLSADQLDYIATLLTARQMILLSNSQLDGLSDVQRLYLVTTLTCDEILTLTNTQLDCLGSAQLLYIVTLLGSAEILALSNTQLDMLGDTQLSHIVPALGVTQVQLLSDPQIESMTLAQRKHAASTLSCEELLACLDPAIIDCLCGGAG